MISSGKKDFSLICFHYSILYVLSMFSNVMNSNNTDTAKSHGHAGENRIKQNFKNGYKTPAAIGIKAML